MDKAGVFDSDIVLKLRQPSIQEAAQFREESTLYSFLYPAQNKDLIDALAARKLTAFGKSHFLLFDSLDLFKSSISYHKDCHKKACVQLLGHEIRYSFVGKFNILANLVHAYLDTSPFLEFVQLWELSVID